MSKLGSRHLLRSYLKVDLSRLYFGLGIDLVDPNRLQFFRASFRFSVVSRHTQVLPLNRSILFSYAYRESLV